MKIIQPTFISEQILDGVQILSKIEEYGRTCYKSESKITRESSLAFVGMLLKRGHESVLEHEKATMRIICDRGVSHEIVRHRIASYSQESTRYCNYAKDSFNGELTFIRPCFWAEADVRYRLWRDQMILAEKAYLNLIKEGALPEEARSILPTSLKTEIIMTMNLREWRHFFKLRTPAAAHPQMREITVPMLNFFQEHIPVIFDDMMRT